MDSQETLNTQNYLGMDQVGGYVILSIQNLLHHCGKSPVWGCHTDEQKGLQKPIHRFCQMTVSQKTNKILQGKEPTVNHAEKRGGTSQNSNGEAFPDSPCKISTQNSLEI